MNLRTKRSFTIHLDPRNYAEFDGLLLDLKNQKLWGSRLGEKHSLLGKHRLEFHRERIHKGPKILHSSQSPTNDVWFNTNQQLLAYDHLIAVDTNTKKLAGSQVSITVALHLIPKGSSVEVAYCEFAVIAMFECWNVKGKPENLGWWKVLEGIENHIGDSKSKIGFIVDSDLGNHNSFNERSKPIFLDYYLPQNVNLIYASDSGAPEHLASKMIMHCDKLANDLYCQENLLMRTEDLHFVNTGFLTHFRQWDVAREFRPFLGG